MTVDVLQLRTHPALVLGKWDLLVEPHWPADRKLCLAALGSDLAEVRTVRAGVRARYIEWVERRLIAVLDPLSATPPDAPVLGEDSGFDQREALAAVIAFPVQTGAAASGVVGMVWAWPFPVALLVEEAVNDQSSAMAASERERS